MNTSLSVAISHIPNPVTFNFHTIDFISVIAISTVNFIVFPFLCWNLWCAITPKAIYHFGGIRSHNLFSAPEQLLQLLSSPIRSQFFVLAQASLYVHSSGTHWFKGLIRVSCP
jgi:hypothetical protein